jgi:hypothetical protein
MQGVNWLWLRLAPVGKRRTARVSSPEAMDPNVRTSQVPIRSLGLACSALEDARNRLKVGPRASAMSSGSGSTIGERKDLPVLPVAKKGAVEHLCRPRLDPQIHQGELVPQSVIGRKPQPFPEPDP